MSGQNDRHVMINHIVDWPVSKAVRDWRVHRGSFEGTLETRSDPLQALDSRATRSRCWKTVKLYTSYRSRWEHCKPRYMWWILTKNIKDVNMQHMKQDIIHKKSSHISTGHLTSRQMLHRHLWRRFSVVISGPTPCIILGNSMAIISSPDWSQERRFCSRFSQKSCLGWSWGPCFKSVFTRLFPWLRTIVTGCQIDQGRGGRYI